MYMNNNMNGAGENNDLASTPSNENNADGETKPAVGKYATSGAAVDVDGATVDETDNNANTSNEMNNTTNKNHHHTTNTTTTNTTTTNTNTTTTTTNTTTETEEPTDSPSKELTLADLYNPRNLTWEELEMHLYEWEEDATAVNEYMDRKVIDKWTRYETNGEWDDDGDDDGDGSEDEDENEDGDDGKEENGKEEDGGEKENKEGGKEQEKKGDNEKEKKEGKEGKQQKENEQTKEEAKEGKEQDKGEQKTGEEQLEQGLFSRLKAAVHREDDGTKTKVESKKGRNHYLNLTDDAAHVVEFYAPWCPHCQHFKWEYVEIAEEVQRRSITPVQFTAVSCDVYSAICATYKINGFPTILGWKIGDSKTQRGIEMNAEENIESDTVGEMLELDMAHEPVKLFDWDIEGEEETQAMMEKLAKQGHAAAVKKSSWHEYQPHTRNDVYHNAALSLAFAIKSQLFQTVTSEGKMEEKRKRALIDFLNLSEWASPRSWKLRTGFVEELQWKIVDAPESVKGRGDIEALIGADMDRHRSSGTEGLWGLVDDDANGGRTGWKGKVVLGRRREELAMEDKHWTKTCTHSVPAKGFTCGLWNLFHILTIGSSKPEHEMYGFHRGYFVSPHHVAETIRNFVAYFFSCDVCRTNFLDMYDDCGHDHCNRLPSEIAMGPINGSDPARMELSLWLWEVHNSVNARLMEEAALRQNREVTPEETLASYFPTKKMCPDCWLDENMTKWDNATVFRFLDDWYWPDDEPADTQFTSVIAGTPELEEQLPTPRRHLHGGGFRGGTAKSSTIASSHLGVGFAALFCVVAFSLIVVTLAQQKRRDGRKKFVDSRYVKKKQRFF